MLYFFLNCSEEPFLPGRPQVAFGTFEKLSACRFLILYFQHQRCELVLNKAEPAAAPNKFHIPAKVLVLGAAFILSFAGCLHYSLPFHHREAAGDISHVAGAEL